MSGVEAVFGVAASAIGVAGVAGQLEDGVRKLNKFRRDVRDAPKELHALTEALNALLGALSHAHESLTAVPATFDSPAVQKALEVCERVARQTSEMVDRANQGMLADRRTTLARLKATLKKDDYLEELAKVQEAKSTLLVAAEFASMSLAQHVYTTTLDTRSAVQSMRGETKEDLALILRQLSKLERGQAVDIQNSLRPNRVGRKQRRATDNGARFYRIQLPHWILSTIYEIGWEPAGRGWQYTLRAIRVVPNDCDFFVACRKGDTATAKRLLDDGIASLLDVNTDHWTVMKAMFWDFYTKRSEEMPLDKRCLESELDKLVRTITLFLTYGAGQTFEESMQCAPEWAWSIFTNAWDFPWAPADHDSLITKFASLLPMCLRGATVPMENAVLSWTVVDLLYSEPTYKQIDSRPWSSVPIRERLSGYLGCGSELRRDFDPSAMLRTLGIDSFELMWSNCDKKTTGRLIEAMFVTIVGSCYDRILDRIDHNHCVNTALRFRAFASSLLERDMLHQSTWGDTFFLRHIHDDRPHGSGVHGSDCCRAAVCMATVLKCLGFDLVEFGEAELQSWAKSESGRELFDGSKWSCFDYGSDPIDWRIYTINRGRERDLMFAQDFWKLVEHPQMYVPGSWPSSIVYCEICGEYIDEDGHYYYWPRDHWR